MNSFVTVFALFLPALLWMIGFFKVIHPRVRRRVLSLEERP